MEKEDKSLILRFRPETELPVFIKFLDLDFASPFQDILGELGFEKLEPKEAEKLVATPKDRWLVIKKASPRVAGQLSSVSSIHGMRAKESLTPKGDFTVYRFINTAMMLFDSRKTHWEMGLMATSVSRLSDLRTVFNRFVALALADFSIIGLWGAPIEDGIVVLSSEKSSGEAVYIDVNNQRLFTTDGVVDFEYGTQILRLDEGLIDRSIKMSNEDLLSFLTIKNNYFSYRGPHKSFSKVIRDIINFSDGYVYPASNFEPRKVLSQSQV